MAPNIDFLEREPWYVFDRDCLAFGAVVDGKPVECLVTAELLMHRFGARGFREQELQEAFKGHRSELQELARQHIESGWNDDDGRVLLTTRHTRLNATFEEQLSASLRQLAEHYHRVLLGIIGPNAETVTMRWETRGADLILGMDDPAIAARVELVFPPTLVPDQASVRMWLARAWGSLLEARSRKLILKSG